MAHTRAVKCLLGLGLVAITVFAATIISIPLWVRPFIAWQSSATVGRPVTIGHLSLHFGHPLTLVAQDVVISNPEAFARDEEPFARIPRLTVRIDLAASLRRYAVVIASIELERPAIRVIATSDGRQNYPLASASRPIFGDLHVVDGRAHVSLADLRADLAVAFATEPPTGESHATTIVAEARGTYAAEPIVARSTVSLPPDARDPSQPWAVEIEVQNGPTQVSAKGVLQDPFSPQRNATVDFLISGSDMARLRPLTGATFPVSPPYQLHGKLDYAAGIYRVTDASGRLGRSELEGTMTVATRTPRRPEITADIRSRSVDLRDIVSLLSSKPGPPGTPGQTPEQQVQAKSTERKAAASPLVLPQAPLHPAKLDRVDVHLAFHASRIEASSMPFDNLALNLDVVNGEVGLHQLSLGIGQGRLSGDIWLAPQAEALQTRADIQFEAVDVSRLFRGSGGFQGAGALNGKVQMEGTGRSIAEILGDASGGVSLWMLGGDFSSLLVDLAGLRLGNALLSSLNHSSTTTVECFIADLALQRGILSTRTLRLETVDAVTEGAGAVDLRNEHVEIRLRTQSKHLTIGMLPVPLLISGTLKDPRAAPDPATPEGRGGLAGALAALPTIQLGIGDASRCESLLRQARKG